MNRTKKDNIARWVVISGILTGLALTACSYYHLINKLFVFLMYL